MSLPAADELFRPTAPEATPEEQPAAPVRAVEPASSASQSEASEAGEKPARRPSGRVRHDEKMTVYVTSDELLGIEHARLVLRSQHGLAVDRGRLVREAIAIALADFDANGEDSVIVKRLSES